jgi:uncharacterized membrane protein YhaH (DUF805 family)
MSDIVSTAFAFKGRIGRVQYWGLSSLCMLALFVVFVSVGQTARFTGAGPADIIAGVWAVVGTVLFFAMLVAFFGIGVRRLHDRGKAGFWIILYYAAPLALAVGNDVAESTALIRIAQAIVVWSIIDLGILEGKPAGDRYGLAAA